MLGTFDFHVFSAHRFLNLNHLLAFHHLDGPGMTTNLFQHAITHVVDHHSQVQGPDETQKHANVSWFWLVAKSTLQVIKLIESKTSNAQELAKIQAVREIVQVACR